MTELIDTTEMYLRTVFELEEEGVVPLRARIAERLGHSGPTVSQTVARMERDGLVRVGGERHLELSEQGRLVATRVMRKHRLAERLLVDVLGLDWTLAHAEACRWEHVISEQVERRILVLIGEQTESPYGNPIPGLAELGGACDTPVVRDGVASLVDLATQAHARGGCDVIVRRIGEPAQVDPESLAELFAAGVVPGASIRIRLQDNGIDVVMGGRENAGAAPNQERSAALPAALAAHVLATEAPGGS